MRPNRIIALLLGGALVVAASPAGASEAERKCEGAKYKCMAGLGSGLLGCYSKDSIKPGAVPGLPECILKVQTKFNGGAFPLKGCFEKVEVKGEAVGSTTPCVSYDDGPDLQSIAETFAAAVAGNADTQEPPASVISKCNAGKKKCLANKVKGLVGCYSKYAKKADPGAVLLNACVAKVKTKFDGGAFPAKGCIRKLEAAVYTDAGCAQPDQTVALESQVDTFVNNIIPVLSCGNGRIDADETCDDDNRTCGDGCDSSCRVELCGDGVQTCNESCDDGNTSNNDACPSDCVIDACTPNGGSHQQATVSFAVGGGAAVAGISVLVDYPEGKVSIPGSGAGAASRISAFPSGTSAVTNDLDHALREVVQHNTPFSTIPVGQLFKIDFETCNGAPAAVAGDFTCTVISASNQFGSDVTGNVTCSVSVP